MSRPRYETEQDRRNEEEAVKRFTKFSVKKVPISYPFDFVLLDQSEKICAAVEVKKRNYELARLPDVFVSARKICGLKLYSRTYNIPSVFLVDMLDGLFYTYIDGEYELTMSGRTDRNDWQDIEPVARIPSSDFFTADGNWMRGSWAADRGARYLG